MENKKNFIFGIRAVIEAINAGKTIDKLLVQKGLQGELWFELFEKARYEKVPIQYVPKEKLNRVTRKNHQGVVAYLSEVPFYNIEDIIPNLYDEGAVPFILVLDGVSDVRNFGALARTAACAGMHAIVIPDKGSAQVNADAVKTSAGALYEIPVCRVQNLAASIKFIQTSGLHVIAANEKAETLYHQTEANGPMAIVLGAEDKGISNDILKIADQIVKIPILGKVQSLNVSAAAAILIYDALQKRQAID